MKRFRDGQWVLNFALIFPLAITLLLLSGPTLSAQEIIDPRSGQLFLSVTDLTLQAGPVSLEIRRSLQSGQRQSGLLGTRWRLNWESRLLRAGPLVLIEESTGSLSFSQQGPAGEYRSALGDRLVFEKTGQAIRTKPDGTKEIFDAQGRLVERDYRNGNRAVVSYGPDGRLAKIDGPHGSFLRFTIDKTGRMTQVEASTTATVRYGYQGGELAEVQRPPAPPIRYSYFTAGQLARIEEPQFGTVQFDYDFKGRVSRRHWADGSKERYEYDDPTTKIRQIDPAGGVTTIQWSQDKRRAEITNPLGHKSVIVSDTVGRPLQITGPTGASARLTYDALGRTIAMENPAGQVTRFEYLGETSRPRAMLRPDGTRQVFEYDRRGNLTALKLGTETLAAFTYHPDGSVATAKGVGTPERRLTYDPAGRLKAVANALGQTTQFQYGTRGNLLRETNPLGGETRYQYDAQDRPVSRTDPVGGITRYEYDAKGRVKSIIDAAGGVNRFDYDARGRLVAETGPTGLVTKYEYDAAGREVKVVEPGNRITTRRYDTLGNVTGLTDPLGRTTQFDYDQLGRLSREHGPTRLEIRYRYDTLGNLVGVEDMTGAKGEFQRDPFGQLTAHVDPLGAVTRYQYDPLGNLLALTDPRGQRKRFAYTPEGRLLTAQEPSGDAARYEYDQAGRLVAIQRPSGGVTRFSYDAMGNVTTEIDPLGNRWRHTYDAAGRLVSSTDAAGQTTRYAYDLSGRLTGKVLPDGKRVTYQYDRLGNLLSADDGAFPIRRSYDPAGRRGRVEYPAIKKAVGYEYDGSGLRTKLIDPAGRATRYEYAADKRLAVVILPDGKRIGLAYDGKDRLQSIRYPNGILGRWEYDAADQVTRITYQDQTGKPIGGWTFRYDPAGNPTEQQDHEAHVTRFQYDAAGQLTEAAGPGGVTRYRYLPGGNRSTIEEGGTAISYRHDAGDRLTQAGQEQLTYDANGELVGRKGSAGTTVYAYDTEGRLVKAVGPDGTPTTFGYAPTGERIWKRDRSGLAYYLYNGLDLIEEVGETGTPMATYIHGPGIDRPLAMLRDGRAFYYHPDRLGSIRLLTDDQGRVAAAYDYDAFGKLTTSQGSVPNPFTYTGREWDASIGLYYYRARYYDPALGRFLSPDPLPAALDEPLKQNSYLYVRNNPLGFVDPLGLNGKPTGPLPVRVLSGLDSPEGMTVREWNEQIKVAARHWGVRGVSPPPGIPVRHFEGSPEELLAGFGRPKAPTAPGPMASGGGRNPTLKVGGVTQQSGLPSIEAPGRPTSGGITPGGVVSGTLTVVTVIAAVTHIVTSDHPAQAAGEVAVGMSGGQIGAVFGGAFLGPPGAIIGGLIGGMVAACLVSPCAGGGPIPYLPPEQASTDPASTVSTPASPVPGGTSPTTYMPLPPEKGPPAPYLVGPPGPHPLPADLPLSPLPPPGERSVDPSAPSGGETLPSFNPLTDPGLPQGLGGPDIPGAGQQPVSTVPPAPGTSGAAGGGDPILIPGQQPPLAGPTESGAGTAQPPPVPAAGGDRPPVAPTLTSFVVTCSPSEITVGQSSSCKATGQYSTQLGVTVDFTHSAAWGPGPTIIGDWPGSWLANASYAGKSATATVTVIADETGQKPDIKGASDQPFSGGIPPSTPTSGVTGGGKEPIEQPGLKPPATGPTEAGTAAGQPPPQQGYWCYSKTTKEWYSIPYGPCPPSDMKPSSDPGSVRVPWTGLTPPPDTVAPVAPTGTGGGCPPGCHIKPATGKCHCGGM